MNFHDRMEQMTQHGRAEGWIGAPNFMAGVLLERIAKGSAASPAVEYLTLARDLGITEEETTLSMLRG
jgi:hypothetical protein